jgi:hypothetical protein
MKFMRHTAGYRLSHHRRNEDTLEKPEVQSGEKKLAQYKQKWWNSVNRTIGLLEENDLDNH